MMILMSAISQGLLWAVMAIGVYVTYRILDYADLTAEGSFTLGAAVSARFIMLGYNPFLCVLISIVAGMIAGLITGILHTKFRIPPLLSGILTMTALYSINLRIMGKANIPLMKAETVMTKVSNLGVSEKAAVFLVGLIAVILVIVFLWLFFNTEVGYALRATGNNADMIRALGVNTNMMKILGLVLGNALVALAGSIVAQDNGYADIGMGTGIIVIGLASVIIGEVVFSDKNSHRSLMAVALGSILYRIIIAFVLFLGLPPTDLKLFAAIVLTVALGSPVFREKFNSLKNALRG